MTCDGEYWKSDRFKEWWDTYHWDALAEIAFHSEGVDGEVATLQDYWREEEVRLIEFGGRKWTSLHLPPVDLDGNPCPEDAYEKAKAEPFWRSVEEKLERFAS